MFTHLVEGEQSYRYGEAEQLQRIKRAIGVLTAVPLGQVRRNLVLQRQKDIRQNSQPRQNCIPEQLECGLPYIESVYIQDYNRRGRCNQKDLEWMQERGDSADKGTVPEIFLVACQHVSAERPCGK